MKKEISYQRKLERTAKIDNYIKENFPEEAQDCVKELTKLVETKWDSVKISDALTGWQTTIKTNKDGYLVITKQRTVKGNDLTACLSLVQCGSSHVPV